MKRKTIGAGHGSIDRLHVFFRPALRAKRIEARRDRAGKRALTLLETTGLL
jgi:hypothetical protein